MLNEKTKLVSMVYISNVLGAILPVEQVAEAAHKVFKWRGFIDTILVKSLYSCFVTQFNPVSASLAQILRNHLFYISCMLKL